MKHIIEDINFKKSLGLGFGNCHPVADDHGREQQVAFWREM